MCLHNKRFGPVKYILPHAGISSSSSVLGIVWPGKVWDYVHSWTLSLTVCYPRPVDEQLFQPIPVVRCRNTSKHGIAPSPSSGLKNVGRGSMEWSGRVVVR